MKWALPIAIAVLAVAACVASASTTQYSGDVDAGGTVSFGLIKKHHHLKVSKFSWDQVPVTCDGGDHHIGGGFTDTVKVNDRRFKESGAPQPGGKIVIHGVIRKHGRASGTFRATGNLGLLEGGNDTGCDTGKDVWHAHAD